MGAAGWTEADALAALGEALQFGIHPSLHGIRALTGALGRPQDALRCVQVTGTNGKTSVARLAGALLAAEGERVGVYTSPHLESYSERIAIDGEPAADAFPGAIGAAVEAARSLGLTCTEFELLTAATLLVFAQAGVRWAVLEVGMGGRWDATSVVSPEVAVVTGVALDHTERLGATVEAIAADKAHVIKAGSTAVLGPDCGPDALPALLERAEEVGAPVVRVPTPAVTTSPDRPGGETTLDVAGARGTYAGLAVRAPAYQARNVAVAVAAAEAALGRALDATAVRGALAAATFPGRFELAAAAPALVLDGAHNPQAAAVLAEAIGEAFRGAPPHLLLAVLADKDAAGIVGSLAPMVSGFTCTRNASSRCLPAAVLAGVVEGVTGVQADAVDDLPAALERAREAGGEAGCVVTGSLYTVGEVRALLRGGDRSR
ncbi:MAG: Mur ligase family protein [Coriobacteriia bacterium]